VPSEALTTDAFPREEAGADSQSSAGQVSRTHQSGQSAEPRDGTPTAPSVLGYEIEDMLGRGKARQVALKRTVALKRILVGRTAEKAARIISHDRIS